MAFGDKDRQIIALQQQVAALQEEIDGLRAFSAPAAEMVAEYEELSKAAVHDLARLPGDIYQAAVDHVRADRRSEVVRRAAGTVALTRGNEIEAEIAEREGPDILRAEEERYAREEEPWVREDIGRQVRQRLTSQTRNRLRKERPAEIEAAFIAEHGDGIRAAEERRFEGEDAPRIRAQAERAARDRITAARRAELTEQIGQEASLAVLRAEEDAARFKLRINTIAENAKRTHQIPMAHLVAGDVLTIELCEAGQTFGDPHTTSSAQAAKKYVRHLRVSVMSPEHGVVMVLDDSWEQGSPLAREASLSSGAILTVGTAVDGSAPSKDKGTPGLLPPTAITRSVPLRMIHNEQDKTNTGYEVDKVHINNGSGTTLLLGEPSKQGYR